MEAIIPCHSCTATTLFILYVTTVYANVIPLCGCAGTFYGLPCMRLWFMVPVRFPCATLLQTHDDTRVPWLSTFCSATTAGALDKFFNFTWTTINSLSTRTLHGNANSSDSRLISTPFSTCTTWATPFYRKGGDCWREMGADKTSKSGDNNALQS